MYPSARRSRQPSRKLQFLKSISGLAGLLLLAPSASGATSTAFHVPAPSVPGWIEAEDFDNGGEGVAYHDDDAANNGAAHRLDEGVDIVTTSAGSGFRVGWMAADEWMNYTVNVLEPGLYRVALKASSGGQGGVVHFAFAGGRDTLPISVPATGGWDIFTTLHSSVVRLEAGIQTIRLQVDAASGFDLDGFSIFQTPATPPEVAIVQPLNHQSAVAGVPVVIEAAASGGEGTPISSVTFFVNNLEVGTATAAPFRFAWVPASEGTFAIHAQAADQTGTFGSSPAIMLPVYPFANRALARLVYEEIPGNLLFDLTNSANLKYPGYPDGVNLVREFESPEVGGTNYGVQLSGFLLPPVSGDYRLYMSSDDQGGLFLSADASPSQQVQIASEPAWNGYREFINGPLNQASRGIPPANISSPIPLEAGKAYSVSGLFKQIYGADHLSVTWQLPGAPEPANGAAPIDLRYLAIALPTSQPLLALGTGGLAGGTKIGVRFSSLLGYGSALEAENYEVPGATVQSVTMGPDNRSVLLTVSGLTGPNFTVRISNVTDAFGNAVPPNSEVVGTVLPVSAQDVGSSGDPLEPGMTIPSGPGDFIVLAGGSDIWNSADGFHFVHEPITGDFSVQVRVEGFEAVNRWSKSGLMAREDLTAGSRCVAVGITPVGRTADGLDGGLGENQYQAIVRSVANQPMGRWERAGADVSGPAFPNAWLRLERRGNDFSAYRSGNGTDWLLLGKTNQNLPATLRVGMATTAHSNLPRMTTVTQYRGYEVSTSLLPLITGQPQPQSATLGDAVTFSVNATGSGQLTYQWQFNGADIAGATGPSLSLPAVQKSDEGSYRVVVSTAGDGVLSEAAVLSVLPGALTIGETIPFAITAEAEVNGWTFAGTAGRNLAVVVETNFSSPALEFAEVSLFDPADNLLARASNVIAGRATVLSDLRLPSTGTYRVEVKAPADQSTSTGHYRIAVGDMIPENQQLVLNEQVNGQFGSFYQKQHWTFSAAAGQQIRFDFLGASGPGALFALRGPNDWIGFENLASSSGLLTLPDSGNYVLTAVGTAGFPNLAYAFKVTETAQTDLVLGTSAAGEFVGSGQAQIFRINLTDGTPLRLALQSAGLGNHVELYAARGAPPTRGAFEFKSSGGGASPQLLIPNASAGTWYVLVYAETIATPGPFTLQASASGLVLAEVAPAQQARNTAFTMRLTGAGFEAGTLVELVAAGGASFPASSVSVDSYTQLSAEFAANVAPVGTYSVRIHQPDSDAVVLTDAFVMLEPGEPKLVTQLIMPGALGRHAVATIYVEYANEGTASMPAPLLVLKSADPDGSDRAILTQDQSRVIQNFWSAGLPPGTANEVFILASGAQPGILNPGERIQVPVYFLGLLQPWDFNDTQVEMEIRYWLADDTSPIDWATRKESLRPPTLDAATWDVVYANLTGDLPDTGAYLRMLNDNAQYLGRLGLHITDVDKLWNFEVEQAYGYSPLPVLDSAVDASLPAPGVTLDLSRRFSANLRARNYSGPFGRGWYTPWQARLVIENSHDLIRLIGEAGSARVFNRDTRNRRFFSNPGDSSSLTVVTRWVVGGIGPWPEGYDWIDRYELRDPDGTITAFDLNGRIKYVQDPNGNRVTATHDSDGKLLSLTHSAGGSLTFMYNVGSLIHTVTDSAGRITTYNYSGEYLQSVTTDDGKATSYTYELNGNLAQRHALTSVTRSGVTRHYSFNTRGHLDGTWVADGEQAITFDYGTAGRVSATDALGSMSFFYDYRGLLAKTVNPLGNVTTSEFDNDLRLSRLVLPTGETRGFTWCTCGSPTSITDELGQTTRFAYEHPLKRMTSFTDARNNTTTYAYDDKGNPLSTTYPNGSQELFGNYTPTGLYQTYANRRGQPISLTYTAVGQLDRQTFADGSYSDYDYDVRGNLVAVVEHPVTGADEVTTYDFTYGTDGDRLRKINYPNGRWVEYFYDAFGRRQRMTDSAGGDTRYDYDTAGRLWRLRDAANDLLVEYFYNDAGRLDQINKGNGTFTTYEYDAAGQILNLINHAPGGAVSTRFDYTYDSRGRRRSMATVDGAWTYDYDATGQLTHAVFASTNPQIPDQDLAYHYDALGNRTSTVINGVTTAYVANNLNQYDSVGGVAQQYDADGNLMKDGLRTFTYDTLNRLTSVTGPEGVTEHEYNAFGNRTATVRNGERTEYLLDPSGLVDVIAEHNGAGGVTARQVQGFGLVGWSSGTGPLNFYEFDALGSTTAITDPAGALANRYSYRPFGETILNTEAVPNPLRFVGQFGVTEEGNGTHFMRARSYISSPGRFVSQDPIRLGAGDANLYRYVLNSPITHSDPLGLFCLVSGSINGGPDNFFGFSFGASQGYAAGLSAGAGAGWTASVGPGGLWGIGTPPGLTPFVAGYGAYAGAGVGVSYGAFSGASFGYSRGSTYGVGFGIGWGGGCGGGGGGGGGGAGGGGGGGGSLGGGGGGGTSNSMDPNQKLGPAGHGPNHYVNAGAALPYRIDFENDASATAPAQLVIVTDQLSPDFDWTSLRFTEVGFGDRFIPIPAGSQHFETTVAMTYGGQTFDVQIEVGLRIATGEVYARFQSIDPATSLPPPVLIGFLPPEDGTGRGMGHFSYVINAKPNLPTGTEIRNIALIEFDLQETIATNQREPHNPAAGTDPEKEALVTIDADSPVSSVVTLPATVTTPDFTVSWSGTDVGSGIVSFDILVSTNDGPFGVWLSGTTETSATFTGQNGSSYRFYSIARDHAGQLQPTPGATTTATTVSVAGDAAVAINASRAPGGSTTHVVLTFPLTLGFNHVIEYRDHLNSGPDWQPLPGSPHNTGTAADDSATGERYYRLKRTIIP